MKLLVIGLGQCGSNIADSFARINKRAKAQRKIEIVTGTFAVNTDIADLTGLKHIKADYKHRILIGGRKSGGHGVGKINELAATMMKEDADKVIDAIRSTPSFFESDAFLLCASAAGGTGSGSIATMTKVLKERYIDKPAYNLIVLPFEHEEHTEERTIYNAATCLKSADSFADAIFLVDNQRYVRKNSPLKQNFTDINQTIAEPFYNILCAGEEKKAKYVGARLVDAGDIIQSIAGWTVVGHGQVRLSSLRTPFQTSDNFRKKSTEIYRGIEAMDAALSELSFKCDPADASRGLYLVSGPGKEINLSSVGEIGEYLKSIAPDAILRNGDYPREKATLSVSVILSELRRVEKVQQYYEETAKIASAKKKRQPMIDSQLREIREASRNVPSLVAGS
jgi:cell division GTPase FtsZ